MKQVEGQRMFFPIRRGFSADRVAQEGVKDPGRKGNRELREKMEIHATLYFGELWVLLCVIESY